MPTKQAKLEEVLQAAQDTGKKTQELLKESHRLQGAVERAHDRARQLHASIGKEKDKARKQRERPSTKV